MTPAELAAALDRPLTWGFILSRAAVLALPVVLLGISVVMARWERVDRARTQQERLDAIGRALRDQAQRMAVEGGTRGWV